MCVDWHQAHWLELARQSSQVRRLWVKAGPGHHSPHLHARPTPPSPSWTHWLQSGGHSSGFFRAPRPRPRRLHAASPLRLVLWCHSQKGSWGGGTRSELSHHLPRIQWPLPPAPGPPATIFSHSHVSVYLAFTSPLWTIALLSGVGGR